MVTLLKLLFGKFEQHISNSFVLFICNPRGAHTCIMAKASLVLGLNEGVTNCIEIGIEAIHYACTSNIGI